MSTSPLSLDVLIDYVRETSDSDALARVERAAQVAETATRVSEHLIGFFVEEARDSGQPWGAIGDRLGITRQATQKRYAPQPGQASSGFFDRCTNDARAAIIRSEQAARERAHPAIGTEHLLLAICADPQSLGVRAIEAGGATPDVVTAAVNGRIGVPNQGSTADHLPFTPLAKHLLELALREALRLGQDHMNSGHIALACFRSAGLATEILNNLGVAYDAAREVVLEQGHGS